MRNYIIITKEQAEAVRGRHGKYSALEPVEFPDGMYAIPERCLDDPEFTGIKETLRKYQKECKVQDITDLPDSGNIEKDKYYLSKDCWVVKAKTSGAFQREAEELTTAYPDKFMIRQDIAAFVEAEQIINQIKK